MSSQTRILGTVIALVFAANTFEACKKIETTIEDTSTVTTTPADNTSTPTEILISNIKDINGSGYIYSLDLIGNVIKEKAISNIAQHFQKWEFNGTIRYTYAEFDPSATKVLTQGTSPNIVVVLDAEWNELKRISLLPHNGRTSSSEDALDYHDFILLDDNHHIAIAYYEESPTNIPASLNPASGVKVAAAIIQEVKNGQVVFEWNSTDYAELYSLVNNQNTFNSASQTVDYMHINSIFVDPKDDNIIASFRGINCVLKIDRISGDIVWKLGGKASDFVLTADQTFYGQHDAQLVDDNTIILYDNGDKNNRPYSRVLELQLNENSKTITSHKTIDMTDVFSSSMGSVQKLQDTYFVGTGSDGQIREYNNSTGALVFQKKLDIPSYRVYKK